MKYKGTASEVQAVVKAIIDTKLVDEAKDYIGTDRVFYLMGCPHVTIRVSLFERDNHGEVRISAKKIARLFSKYPEITKRIAELSFIDNPVFAGAKCI